MFVTLKDKIIKYNLFIIFIVLWSVWLNTQIDKTIFIDNELFKHSLDQISLFSFLKNRYLIWSGRFFIEGVMVETIGRPYFWEWFIPFCAVLAAYAIWSATLRKSLSFSFGIPLVLMLMLLVPHGAFEQSVYWLTGFYVYLFPVSFAFFSVSVFIRQKKTSPIVRFFSLMALPVACSVEQSALFLLLCTGLYWFINRVNSVYCRLYFLVAGVISGVVFIAPGNKRRYFAEIEHWFPEFPQFSLGQKLSFALDRIHDEWGNQNNFILLLALILTVITLNGLKRNRTLQDVLATGFCVLSAVLVVSHFVNLGSVFTILRAERFLVDLNWVYLNSYMALFIMLATIASLLWCALSIKDSIVAFTALLAGVLITLLMGFSPTVYVSSNRILFLMDMTLVIYACCLLQNIMLHVHDRFLLNAKMQIH
ncbi:hypothetical protein HK13_14545 [Acetobacter indonesiensis]|nr:hypothetical protein HK13_14545 [Acetobacter indonesiensis]